MTQQKMSQIRVGSTAALCEKTTNVWLRLECLNRWRRTLSANQHCLKVAHPNAASRRQETTPTSCSTSQTRPSTHTYLPCQLPPRASLCNNSSSTSPNTDPSNLCFQCTPLITPVVFSAEPWTPSLRVLARLTGKPPLGLVIDSSALSSPAD